MIKYLRKDGSSVFTTLLLALASVCMIVLGFGKDGKGVIIRERRLIVITSLASGTAIFSTGSIISLGCQFRMIKCEGTVFWRNPTAGEMCWIGLASLDTTVAQIKSCVENNGPTRPSDQDEELNSMRPVYILGHLQAQTESGHMSFDFEKTIRWTFNEDVGYAMFAYNPNTVAISGNGSDVIVMSKSFGVWVT